MLRQVLVATLPDRYCRENAKLIERWSPWPLPFEKCLDLLFCLRILFAVFFIPQIPNITCFRLQINDEHLLSASSFWDNACIVQGFHVFETILPIVSISEKVRVASRSNHTRADRTQVIALRNTLSGGEAYLDVQHSFPITLHPESSSAACTRGEQCLSAF